MKLCTLKNNNLEITEVSPDFSTVCDILCVGAGAAGIYASDSAAREGSNVILLEYSSSIGGMHVRGNVCCHYYGDEGGSYLETEEKCTRDVFLAGDQQPETRQVLHYKRLQKSGVKILCSHTPIGIYMEDNRVVGLLVLSENGIFSIGAKMVIDSTSDGHLIRMLPVKKFYGRKNDGKTVPFTVRTQYFSNRCFMSINDDSGYINQYDKSDFSQKTIIAHAKGAKFIEKGEFINLASITGVREGLFFEGEETVRLEDILYGTPYKKTLFYAYSDIDKHGHDMALDEEIFQNWFVISNLSTVTASINVPMGCIVPKHIKGIVTAGRCISADSYSLSGIRMNKDMFRMGECVGVGASMAVKENCDFLDIDYEKYLSKVNERGCFKSTIDRKFGFANRAAKIPYVPIEFGVDKNLHLLETATPGTAIWSCFVSNDKARDCEKIYQKLISSKTDLEKYNCAIALGIMNDCRALPTLRKIIKNRDAFRFTDCRRSNQLRTSIAICLLGRIGEISDIPLLESIVFDDSEFEKPMYREEETEYYNPVYFDVFSYSATSIISLYKKCGKDLSSLHQKFSKLFENDRILKKVTSYPYGHPYFMEISHFQKYVLNITET